MTKKTISRKKQGVVIKLPSKVGNADLLKKTNRTKVYTRDSVLGMPNDPTIDTVAILAPQNGGGIANTGTPIYSKLIPNVIIGYTDNPTNTANPNPSASGLPDTSATPAAADSTQPKKGFPWIPIIIAVVVIGAIIYFVRKK